MSLAMYSVFVRFPMVLTLLGLLLMGTFSKRGWRDWRQMVSENYALGSRIQELGTQKQDLERKLVALQSNRQDQEQAVRKYLGYVRRGELIVEIP